MKTFKEPLILILAAIFLVSLLTYYTTIESNNNNNLISPNGCCMITIEHQVSDKDTSYLDKGDNYWTINYHDYKTGKHMESVEFYEAERDYIIELFQEQCTLNHNH